MIAIENLNVGYQQRQVLSDINLRIPDRGIVALLGPGGVGKTTLLRTLARWNDALPSFWFEGDIRLDDTSLLTGMPREQTHRLVPMLAQKATLYTATVVDNAIDSVRPSRPLGPAEKMALAHEVLAPLGLWEEYEELLPAPVLELSIGQQRRLSIARLVASGARCLLVDEPLRDLSPADTVATARVLRRRARDHAIVLVTHNQHVARELADTVCLITAGRVVETGPCAEFFSGPSTELGQEFVRSGNCWPKQGAELGPVEFDAPMPGGFHWVLPGLLGGMQRPGLLGDEVTDLMALRRLGCQVLVTLTEEPYSHELLEGSGLRRVHFPIVDMQAPSLADAHLLCQQVARWLDLGMPTVVHCKAGLGRTGTMLACTLVYRGDTAVHAIEQVRSINPYYIQSAEQLAFIAEFAGYLRRENG